MLYINAVIPLMHVSSCTAEAPCLCSVRGICYHLHVLTNMSSEEGFSMLCSSFACMYVDVSDVGHVWLNYVPVINGMCSML